MWFPGWVCREGDDEFGTPSPGSAQCLAHGRCSIKRCYFIFVMFLVVRNWTRRLHPQPSGHPPQTLGSRTASPAASPSLCSATSLQKALLPRSLGKFLVRLQCVRRFLPEGVCLAPSRSVWSGEPVSSACSPWTVRPGLKLGWPPPTAQAPVPAGGSWTPQDFASFALPSLAGSQAPN